MKSFVEYLVKKLVDDPDAVHIEVIEDERGTLYEVSVAQRDMGKVIGREGRVANAIRTVVKSVATKRGERAHVEIVHLDEREAGGRNASDVEDPERNRRDADSGVEDPERSRRAPDDADSQ